MRIARFAAMIATTILVLAVAYFGLKILMTSESVAGSQSLSYRLDINESSEVPVLHARQGDRIALIVTSSRAGELYIHGLDKPATPLTPRLEAKVAFIAESSGRYYIHLHEMDHSHTEVAVIEVEPR